MKSQEKKIKLSKIKLDQVENPLLDESNLQQKPINNLQKNDKKEKVNFPNIYSNLNVLTSNQKLNTNKSKLLNLSMKKINKLCISTKSKNSDVNNINDFNKVNDLSKISKRELSDRSKANKILESLNDSNIRNKLELSKLNSSREENPIFKNITRKNINYFRNTNKNNITELNEVKIKYDNFNIESSSFLNKISENNSNNNTNITTQRKTKSNHYIKTDAINNISNININSFKDLNLKLVLPIKNNFNNKLILNCQTEANDDNPVKLDINLKKENNIKSGNNIKKKKMYKRNEGLISEDIVNSNKDNFINNITAKNNLNKSNYIKKDSFSCPEDLHFYYIDVIQRGKRSENNF